MNPIRASLALTLACTCTVPMVAAAGRDTAVPRMGADATRVLRWIEHSGDARGLPFIIIDKRQAHLWLFDAHGQPRGNTPVLLGIARGDHTVPGVGERELRDIRPHERTTPAGRFVAELGRNLAGEDIYWIDYDAAVSLHRVRATNVAERRLQRLATPTPADNRISYGCVNVPAAFYDAHIRTLFRARPGVIYLLPEALPLRAVFGSLQAVAGP